MNTAILLCKAVKEALVRFPSLSLKMHSEYMNQEMKENLFKERGGRKREEKRREERKKEVKPACSQNT
jgi:hypothetical protein